jgi:hypothetical protein
MKKLLALVLMIGLAFTLTGCDETPSPQVDKEGEGTKADVENQFELQDTLSTNQPTPTDFSYSLERYNLIKRAYWINGQRGMAAAVTIPITDMPMGYVGLYFMNGVMHSAHVVSGKVSSLNSYLTKDENCEVDYDRGQYGGGNISVCRTLADVDGSYGENDAGIFFFNTYGEYVEWNYIYYYTDYAFDVPETAINRVFLPTNASDING